MAEGPSLSDIERIAQHYSGTDEDRLLLASVEEQLLAKYDSIISKAERNEEEENSDPKEAAHQEDDPINETAAAANETTAPRNGWVVVVRKVQRFWDAKRKIPVTKEELQEDYLDAYCHEVAELDTNSYMVQFDEDATGNWWRITVNGETAETVEFLCNQLDQWISYKIIHHNYQLTAQRGKLFCMELDSSQPLGATLVPYHRHKKRDGLLIEPNSKESIFAKAVGDRAAHCVIVYKVDGRETKTKALFQSILKYSKQNKQPLALEIKYLTPDDADLLWCRVEDTDDTDDVLMEDTPAARVPAAASQNESKGTVVTGTAVPTRFAPTAPATKESQQSALLSKHSSSSMLARVDTKPQATTSNQKRAMEEEPSTETAKRMEKRQAAVSTQKVTEQQSVQQANGDIKMAATPPTVAKLELSCFKRQESPESSLTDLSHETDDKSPNKISKRKQGDNGGYLQFFHKFDNLVIQEFRDGGNIHKNAAMGSMWSQHKKLGFGEMCSEDCGCVKSLPELTRTVVTDQLRKKKSKWDNPHDLGPGDYPVGIAGNFARTFLPLLVKERPNEKASKLMERLLTMWDIHYKTRIFDFKCQEGCDCAEAWELSFKKGALPGESLPGKALVGSKMMSVDLGPVPKKRKYPTNAESQATDKKCKGPGEPGPLVAASLRTTPKKSSLLSAYKRTGNTRFANSKPQDKQRKSYEIEFDCDKSLGFYAVTEKISGNYCKVM